MTSRRPQPGGCPPWVVHQRADLGTFRRAPTRNPQRLPITPSLAVLVDEPNYVIARDASSGAQLAIPKEWLAVQRDAYLLVGTEEGAARGRSPSFYLEVFNVPLEFAQLPKEEALRRIALRHVNQADIGAERFHHNGLEIHAATMIGNYFFVYDRGRNRAAGFASEYDGFFGSQEFLIVLATLVL